MVSYCIKSKFDLLLHSEAKILYLRHIYWQVLSIKTPYQTHIEKISILFFPLKYDISRDCVREVLTERGFDEDDACMETFVNKVAEPSNVKQNWRKET